MSRELTPEEYLTAVERIREQRVARECREQLWQDMDELANALDGRVMSVQDLQRVIEQNADTLRDAWRNERELLFIGFGLNDGDTDFTVTARFWTP